MTLLQLALALPGCEKHTDGMALRRLDAAVTIVAVEPAGVAGAVHPCPSGEAHPLVCCVGGPGVAPSCFEDTSSPFQQCPNDAFAFPDGRTCCPLDGSSGCAAAASPVDTSSVDASSNAGESGPADAGATMGASCSFPCPPGAYSNAAIGFEPTTPTCSDSELSLPEADCLYCCFDDADGGASCLSNACSCTGDHPCSCIPSCPSCPSGWKPPSGSQFDLCCQQSSAGRTSCFSQSTLVSMPS